MSKPRDPHCQEFPADELDATRLAARMVAVHPSMVRRAAAIKDQDPELFQKVFDGSMTLNEATRELARRGRVRA